jgi:hypothetical protein
VVYQSEVLDEIVVGQELVLQNGVQAYLLGQLEGRDLPLLEPLLEQSETGLIELLYEGFFLRCGAPR